MMITPVCAQQIAAKEKKIMGLGRMLLIQKAQATI
jgi:hypothetical protein